MTSVNNLPDAAAKANSLVSNILSSLQASFGSNSAVEGLFANFLSQYQIPGLSTQTSAPAQNSNAANNAQSSQNANSDNTGNSNSGSSNVSNNAKIASGWTQIGKVSRQNVQTGPDNTKSQQTNSKDSSSSPNANSASPAASNQPTTVNAAASSGSNNTPPGDTQRTGNTGNNATTGDNAQTAAGTNAATGNAASANGSSATDTSATGAAANTQNASGTPGQDSISSELIALILQLERLAASQTAAAPTTAMTDAAANTGAQTGATQGANSDPGSNIDLKGLLAAIAGLDNNGNAGAGGLTGDTVSADNQDDATAAIETATAQTSPSASGTAQTQQTIDKLASTDFLSVFSLANNQNNAAPPLPILNPVAGAALTTGGNSDGASLDANAQGQNGTGARDASTALSADSTTSPLAAGATQASNPYDFASQLSALRAAKGGPTGLPTPVEQVVLQLSRGLGKDGSSQMTIQLKPAELGRVDVKLTIGSDGKVQGTVTADNSTTLGLLVKDSRGLERALQEAGLRADPGSLQFSLRGDGQPGNNFGQTAGNQPGSGGNTDGAFDSSTSLPAYADGSETYYVTPGGVNMRV